jgi:hypothetical protein
LIEGTNLQDSCDPEIVRLARRQRPISRPLSGTPFVGNTNIVARVEFFVSYCIASCASSEPPGHVFRTTGRR